MTKSIFNLNQNLAAALSYLFGPLTGLIFYIGESVSGNKNKYVQFHALQSTIYFGALCILQGIMSILRFFPFMGLFRLVIDCVILVSVVYLMYMAYTGKNFKLPIIGEICWEQVNKA